MSQKLNYIDNEGVAVTLVADGKAYTIAAFHGNYKGIMDALLAEDWDRAKELADIATAVKSYVSAATKDVEIRGNAVYYKGEALGGAVVDKILRFMNEGKPTGPLVAFVERLMANPSFGSRERLYAFLAAGELPITSEGFILAYKAVKSDYFSKTAGKEPVEVSTDGGKTWETFTGHIPNNVGNIVKVDRSRVDDNPNNHCSYGLHAGQLAYVRSFGSGADKKVIVQIDPADVVSVPTDCGGQKLRTAKYTVISDFQGEFKTALADTDNLYGNDDDYESEEDGEYLDF